MEKIRSKKDEANEKIAIMVTAIEKGEGSALELHTAYLLRIREVCDRHVGRTV